MQNIYLLSNQKHKDTKSLSVIDINFLHVDLVCKEYEAIVFTSKNAVFSIDKIDKNWKDLEVYSIGKGTSKAVKSLGGKVFYESNIAYGDEFAKDIAKKLQNKKVLFPHAKEVVSNVFDILKDLHVRIDEKIVYETVCKPCVNLENLQKNSIFIFTSPSTVKCFFEHFKWQDSFTAIAIGKKTQNAFPKNIFSYVSAEQSIDECVKFAKKLSKDYL